MQMTTELRKNLESHGDRSFREVVVVVRMRTFGASANSSKQSYIKDA